MTSTKMILSAAVLAALASGCQSLGPAGTPGAAIPATPPTADANGIIRADVTDIRPTATASAQPAGLLMSPMYDSPAQPITADPISAPAMLVIPTIASAHTTPVMSIASAGTHTVRAGETLFSIARSAYGSGKQWRKIALANPGLSPSTLRVGQTITVP